MANDFFEEVKDQSRVKTAIVAKYFSAWATAIIPSARKHSNRIAYLDLFAGPGKYDDGTKSTPILILETAIRREDMRQMLVTHFNDKNAEHASSLQQAIESLDGVDSLKYKPQVYNYEVGHEIIVWFQKNRLVPSLLFADPWGYKGLSLKLIGAILKNWGCDCIFFFNYNRVNMALHNALAKGNMELLFGDINTEFLQVELENTDDPIGREAVVIEALAMGLKEIGGKYILPFRFRNEAGNRTSHHLIFVSKHFLGYEIMKGIMARECSSLEQGVPSFEYNPVDKRCPMLFELSRPLDDLEYLLVHRFSGRMLTMKEIYMEHNVGTPYISKNYKDVLIKMEADGKIFADPPAEKRKKIKGKLSMADTVRITFPLGKDS